jgi:hypothetical protein
MENLRYGINAPKKMDIKEMKKKKRIRASD